MSVREANLQILKKQGFKPAEWLPTERDAPDKLRPLEERALRALAMLAVYAWASAPPEQVPDELVRGFVKDNGLEPWLTPDEREILALSRPKAHEQHSGTIGWKLEALWALAWTLGFEHEPPVAGGFIDDEMTGELLFELLPGPLDEKAAEWMAELPEPKPSEDDVKRLEDLFYCAHNAVRSAQLGHSTVPRGFDPMADGGCVHERRHALTWCLSDCPWDETDLST